MASALGVTVTTWARWERGKLAIHPAYQLLLDFLEHRVDRDAERTAARLCARGASAISGEQPLLGSPLLTTIFPVVPP
jgi:hypothetical protein